MTLQDIVCKIYGLTVRATCSGQGRAGGVVPQIWVYCNTNTCGRYMARIQVLHMFAFVLGAAK